MKTPITDSNRLEIWTDPYTESPQEDGDFVRFEIARRIELDRAALLEFAIRVRNTTSSTRIKREATAAIAEARANFPE